MSFYVTAWIIYLQFICVPIWLFFSNFPDTQSFCCLCFNLKNCKWSMLTKSAIQIKNGRTQLAGMCCTGLFELLLRICSAFRCPFIPIWDSGHDGTRPLNSFLNCKGCQLIEDNWHCSWYNWSWRWWIIFQGFFTFGGIAGKIGFSLEAWFYLIWGVVDRMEDLMHQTASLQVWQILGKVFWTIQLTSKNSSLNSLLHLRISLWRGS